MLAFFYFLDYNFYMTKIEYYEAREGLTIEEEEKLESARVSLKEKKDEYKKYVRQYHDLKRIYKEEYKAKKTFLVNDFKGTHKEAVRVKEKYLSDDEILLLRSKLKLPFYRRGEEIFNMVSHIVGAGYGVIYLILGIIFSCLYKTGDSLSLVSMILFSLTIITLYSISSIYHGLRINQGKRVFQVLDHCTIYLLIAGTYLPVCLLAITHIPYNYIIFSSVLSLAVLGVVLNATMMRKMVVKVISMILYIAVGWGIIFFYPWLVEGCLGLIGTWLLIAGGLSYTIGSILYGIGSKKRYWHSIFHLFVLLGTLLQSLAILLYVIIGI